MTKVLSQPFFPDKRCSKACICGNKPNQTKIGGAIFVWLLLLLDAGQLFHNLFFRK
ncbi:hypothetical protein HMPREF1345_01967 [Enterococcus faecium TX1337RF]|nr:hypothetical protein HMPREF1345_01967 [Enterococcus faecium TX1337RF]